jgi:heterodisulfide reductase subunit A
MYAIKEAVIAKEHIGNDLDCAIFYMDIRTHGKEFERFYDNAREKQGVRFIRSKVHSVTPVGNTDDLEIRYISEDGELKTEIFDMVVLSVGLEVSSDVVELARQLNIELTPGNFCQTQTFSPVETSRDGIFVCGVFQGPKDIPQAVVDSSAAATAAGEILTAARHTKTTGSYPANQCHQRAPQNRGIRLSLWYQHCGSRGCAVGCRICRHLTLCGICNRKSLFLFPGHPGNDNRDY